MNSMLETKTLAVEARAQGLDKDPEVQARIAAQTDRVLAMARSEQIEREAEAAFDRRRDDFIGRAREIYLLDKAKYTAPEQVRVSAHPHQDRQAQQGRGAEDRAGSSRARRRRRRGFQRAGAPILGGRERQVEWRQSGLDLRETGRSRVLDRGLRAAEAGRHQRTRLTSFGYHIIRLDGKKAAELQPFEAVKEQALAEVKRDYVKAAKNTVLDTIFKDPTLQMNQPAIDSLTTSMDSELFRKAGAAVGK